MSEATTLTKLEARAAKRPCPTCGLTQYRHPRGWRHLSDAMNDDAAYDRALAAHDAEREATDVQR